MTEPTEVQVLVNMAAIERHLSHLDDQPGLHPEGCPVCAIALPLRALARAGRVTISSAELAELRERAGLGMGSEL